MIAVDTNLLVYAHRKDADLHEPAASGSSPWAIPWPCVAEFYSIVTHPRIYAPPSPSASAIDQLDAWLESPTVQLIAEGEGHWGSLRMFSCRLASRAPSYTTPESRHCAPPMASRSCGRPIGISDASRG